MYEHVTSVISKASTFALDLETTGLDPLSDRILGIALAAEDQAWYLELPQDDQHEAVFQTFWNEFQDIFKDTNKLMVLHNAKFDLAFLRQYGLEPDNPLADTMIASHMLDENTRNGLKECVERELGYKMTQFEEVGGLFAKNMEEYAEDDARYTLKLWNHYKPQMEKEELLEGFHNIEMPLIRIIVEMEMTGVHIDSLLLIEYGRELRDLIQRCRDSIYQLAGVAFDIASQKQLAGVLYGKLQLPTDDMEEGKNGCFPTDDRALKNFKKKYPIIPFVLDWRRFNKLLNTYVKPLLEHVRPETGRLHSSFWQTGTVTGRLSSSKPINFQNITNDERFVIRKAFRAAPGHKLIVSDFSAIELRLLAHASQEPTLLTAFRDGRDVHQETANLVGCSRKNSKTVSFGLLYGMGPNKLAYTIGSSLHEAQKLMDRYFSVLPNVKEYISAVHGLVKDQGWVRTLISKRRRRFKEIDGRAYRQSVNFIIQGTAADLMKKALIDTRALLDTDPDCANARMLMTIHDEIVIEIKSEFAEKAAQLVKEGMENAWEFSIPTPCSLEICDTWDEGKD